MSRSRDLQHPRVHRAGAGPHRRVGIALALALALLPVPAAHAAITYQCGVNLCRIAADGSGQAQVTSDGTTVSPYTWPSLSRDGTRMSWIRNGDLYLGSASAQPSVGPVTRSAIFAVIRPDGAQVGALEHSYAIFTGDYVKVFDAAGAQVLSGPQPVSYSLGWAPDNALLLPWTGTPKIGICVAADTGGTWNCVTRVAGDPAADLNFPAVSPDGRLLAVDAGGRIALFDYAAHTLVRYVTAGPGDTTPAWSPDSSSLVFQHSAGGASTSEIRIVRADGTGERVLAGGGAQTPTWGGPAESGVPAAGPSPAPGAAPAATGLVVVRSQRGGRVQGRLVVATAGSRLSARLTSTGGRPLGATTRRGLRAGALRFTVALNGTGRSALRRSGVVKLRLKVVVTAPSGAASTLTAAVSLRR